MSDYITTRESMGEGTVGDRRAMQAHIHGILNTFVEDLIIEPPTSFFYNSNYIHTLHLVNLRVLKSSSISNCNLLTVLNLPDLEEINGSAIYQLNNLEIIGGNGLSEQTLPKLKYIQGNGIYYLSKLQSLYLPELLYVRNGIKFLRQNDGGHQEQNHRSGTENTAGIVGLRKSNRTCYKRFRKI